MISKLQITQGMKKEDTYHRAINEFLNPEAAEQQKNNSLFRIDATGAGKRMTQTNPREQESRLPEGKE